jgi:hypothetical protein
MSEWKIRPYQASDESGVTFLWLNSWLCGPFGRRIGAMRHNENGDMRKVPEVFRAAWTRYQPVVERLIERCPPRIICDPEAEDIIWAFSCQEHTSFCIHAVVIKRSFAQFTDSMLLDIVEMSLQPMATRYTHEMPDVPMSVRANWTYDREALIPLLARSGT